MESITSTTISYAITSADAHSPSEDLTEALSYDAEPVINDFAEPSDRRISLVSLTELQIWYNEKHEVL